MPTSASPPDMQAVARNAACDMAHLTTHQPQARVRPGRAWGRHTTHAVGTLVGLLALSGWAESDQAGCENVSAYMQQAPWSVF